MHYKDYSLAMKNNPASLFIVFLSIAGLTLTAKATDTGTTLLSDKATVIYLVRHAEKDLNTKQDPDLTEIGQKRARALSKLFKHTDLTAVYSTNTKRTINTATPTANSKGKKVTLYDHKTLSLDTILERHSGSSLLIVGHSNTTPMLSNRFSQKEVFSDIAEDDYSNLFIVTLQGGSANVQRLNAELVTQ